MNILLITQPLLAGIAVAMVAGILGCFVVWRRLAYFGDSLGHSTLLGIVFGILTGISQSLGIIMICSLFALLLVWLKQKKITSLDSLLGILAHSSLAIGVIAMTMMGGETDLHDYLFGDILEVTTAHIIQSWLVSLTCLGLIIFFWRLLLLATINEDLVKAEGGNVFFINLFFMFLVAIFVAISIKIVGILLITSLLIIPAVTARQISNSPKKMAIFASIFGIISVFIGIQAALFLDVPSGPAIVLGNLFLFILVLISAGFFNYKK